MRKMALCIITYCFVVFGAHAAEDEGLYHVFESHDNEQVRIDDALRQAQAENKRLLLILGANWCHDSTGLVKKFSHNTIKETIEAEFVTLYVDVGNFRDQRSLVQQFGYPIYFATPTVMVIDPTTKRLLNQDSLAMFNNADNLSEAQYRHYFSQVPKDKARNPVVSAQARQSFEQQQSERLMQAYILLRPLMQADDEGRLENKEAFYALWGQVRDFRFQLQKDIHALRSGELEEIPTYPAQAWE